MSIPEDVMKTARDVCGDIAFGCGVITEHDLIVPTEEGSLIIARALMAERERCARIADDEATHGCGCNPVALGERIADRIRNAQP